MNAKMRAITVFLVAVLAVLPGIGNLFADIDILVVGSSESFDSSEQVFSAQTVAELIGICFYLNHSH